MSIRSNTNTDYTFPAWAHADVAAVFASKTQMFLSFWLKVGTWPTGADSLVGFLRTDFTTGGWALFNADGTDTLKFQWYGVGAAGGQFDNCIAAPIAGQGWMHCGFHCNLHSGALDIRAYKNGTVFGTVGVLEAAALAAVTADLLGASNHTSIKIAEPAIWTASDGSLTSGVAQTLATALAAGTLPTGTSPVATWYAPCRDDLVTVIG